MTAKNDTLQGTAGILEYDIIDRVELVKDKKKTNYTAIQVKAVFMKGERKKILHSSSFVFTYRSRRDRGHRRRWMLPSSQASRRLGFPWSG